MKTKLRIFVVLLILSLFTSALSGVGAPQQQRRENPLRHIKARTEKGPNVGNRIRQLRGVNNSVHTALEAFERRGHPPKIDEAISIRGGIDRAGQVAYETGQVGQRKANHASQQATITGDGVEVIFITALGLYNEWQGTTIANFYDANGALEEQYVANVVITRSEFNPSDWTARFELKYEADGIGYLNHRPGMFTSFALGTSIQQQAAPLSLDPSQFASPDQMSAYYNLYPEQVLYDDLPPGGGDRGGGILPLQPTRFAKPQRGGLPGVGAWTFYTITGWGSAARTTGLMCGSAAGGCGLASAIFAEVTFGGCAVAGCGAGVIYAAATNLRIRRR
jgi:hypothetical protein